jgi:hypothetical protein
MTMKRRFIDAPCAERCVAAIFYKDGSGARCGRYRKLGQFCRQHQAIEARKIAAEFNAKYKA